MTSLQVCPWAVGGAARAIALSLEHACDAPSLAGVQPMGEILRRYGTWGVLMSFLYLFTAGISRRGRPKRPGRQNPAAACDSTLPI